MTSTQFIATPVALSDTQMAALRDMIDACKGNKNEQALMLIEALIEEGIATRRQIRDVASALGLNASSVTIQLNENTGNVTGRHRWNVGADGIYSLNR